MLRTLVFILLMSSPCFAVDLPKDLTRSERQEFMRIVGVTSHSKLLSNPYALGGHSGFEFGLSFDLINTRDFNDLKPVSGEPNYDPNTPDYQDQISIPQISIGKGLYHNFDLYFNFTPFLQESGITQYGGLLKWNFFQATFVPLSLAFLTHMNQMSINDSYSNVTAGIDLVMGLNVENVAVYIGAGQLEAESQFQSGDGSQAIVDPTDGSVNDDNIVVESTREAYTFAGMSIQISKAFVALQITKHKDPSYAAKLGFRF